MASPTASRSPLEGGGRRRPPRRRSRRAGLLRLAAAVLLGLVVAGFVLASGQDAPRHAPRATAGGDAPPAHAGSRHGGQDTYGTLLAPPGQQVAARFNHPPAAGLLFDLPTGRVLWARNPAQIRPIASVTKMMTALLTVEREPATARPLVTQEALQYQGSGVGLLPRGKRVGLVPLLYGLMLPSGNDAARVLAQDVGRGSIPRFVALMNQRARQLGLTCTHFAGPDGYDDANRSCPQDLARLAHAVMREPLLRRVVGTPYATFPFPIKAHKLYLAGHNPLYRIGYRGWTGIKTGYSPAAGECFVGTARRDGVQLGVVLLDSPNAGQQAAKLLDRGFAAERRPVFAPLG